MVIFQNLFIPHRVGDVALPGNSTSYFGDCSQAMIFNGQAQTLGPGLHLPFHLAS